MAPHHQHHIMKTHPSQRSPLQRNLRRLAAQALREYRTIHPSLAFERGLKRGEAIAFRTSADYGNFLSNDISQPYGQRPDYGRPAFLQQPVPEQSIEEMEAEGRVNLTPKRVNIHE